MVRILHVPVDVQTNTTFTEPNNALQLSGTRVCALIMITPNHKLEH